MLFTDFYRYGHRDCISNTSIKASPIFHHAHCTVCFFSNEFTHILLYNVHLLIILPYQQQLIKAF